MKRCMMALLAMTAMLVAGCGEKLHTILETALEAE